MKQINLLLIFVGIVAATHSGFAGNATLTSVNSFSGTVSYNSADTDWRVFSAINNSGSAVISSSGGGLISGIFTDAGTSSEQDSSIPASWTGGAPVSSATTDPGYFCVVGGTAYGSKYTHNPNYAYLTITSPGTDYTIDLYIINFYQPYLDLTLINGSQTNTYNNFASGLSIPEYISIDVTGSTVGSLTTIQFTDFTGSPTWGQLGFFSADVISVPEPTTLALAGLGSTGLFRFRFRRRK